MYLHEWLFENDMSTAAFCRKIEISPQHIRQYLKRLRTIGKHLSKEIERFTEGKVTVQELESYSKHGMRRTQ